MKIARIVGMSIYAVVLVLCFSTFAVAAASCALATFSSLGLPETTISSAVPVPAGGGLPAYCKVQGKVDPAINFEVWLPTEANWNGKFNGVGNGGLAGFINTGDMGVSLARGYATASTDTGHVGDPTKVSPPVPLFDASWALDPATGKLNMGLLEDFGYRSIHEMTVTSKAIVRAYYGWGPRYSYFTGCSGGGQQGLAEAQRYPDDYHGIVSGAPANYPVHMWPGEFFPAVLMRNMDVNDLVSKLGLIEAAVMAQCDLKDGVKDGLVDDPRRCDFDAATLLCKESDDPAKCLTALQVGVVNLIYAGLRDPFTGEQIWPGFEPSSEPGWEGHLRPFAIQVGYFAYMVFKNPTWDWKTFDYSDYMDYVAMMNADALLGPILNATDPDLRAFGNRGGKMIMYHGWIDQNIAPRNSISYYESVEAAMVRGKGKSKWKLGDFLRLFMVPGMGHCGGGPGPTTFDALGALEQWVEKGIAPDRIKASNSSTGLSRPLCPYPQVARYKGWGSTNDSRNFFCVSRGHDDCPWWDDDPWWDHKDKDR
jgi:feruloyl esterase